MLRAGLAVLVLGVSPLLVACSADPTCDDVESLEQRLDDMDPDDPDFNDVVEDLTLAQADCNAG